MSLIKSSTQFWLKLIISITVYLNIPPESLSFVLNIEFLHWHSFFCEIWEFFKRKGKFMRNDSNCQTESIIEKNTEVKKEITYKEVNLNELYYKNRELEEQNRRIMECATI